MMKTNQQLNNHVEDCTCNACLPFDVIESVLDENYWSKEWNDLDIVIVEH